MKRAVSISIGSSKRNKAVELRILGEQVSIERIGTDGDMEMAAQLFKELDGKVDAFGVGGTDLGFEVGEKWYPLRSVQSIVRFVRNTPLVDGGGLKSTLEKRLAPFIDENIGDYVRELGRNALITSGVDRWGMSTSFEDNGYACVFGDLMFALGFPIPLRSTHSIKILAALLIPILGRIPFEWLYPTGEKQEKREPRFNNYYQWATVVAGDCHYVKRHLPYHMDGRIIATNTTTPSDIELFRESGVKFLVTSTPVIEGRSFGTNVMEAALVAAAGKGRKLTFDEINDLLDKMDLNPQLQELN